MLTAMELDRYARHIVLPGVGARGQLALRGARAFVVGAGGLGAPILTYLAAAGVGEVAVADDDVVSLSNLQRQVLFATEDVGRKKVDVARRRLEALNPGVRIVPHDLRLRAGNIDELIAGYDVVVDGSDNFPTRYVVNDACARARVPLVYGAVSQFDGQTSVLVARARGGDRLPCYRCVFPEPPEEGSVPSCSEAGVFGALTGVIGSLMASEALKVLAGVGDPLGGALLHIDLLDGSTHRFDLRRDPDCAACGDASTAEPSGGGTEGDGAPGASRPCSVRLDTP